MKHRMQIGKTALSFLLTLAMVFGMFPAISTPALADDLELQNDEAYNLWIGGVQVTSANLSGEGWSYDADSNTLTLNNFSSTTIYEPGDVGRSVIYNGSSSDLTIELNGNNILDASAASGQAHGYCVTYPNKTTFTGSGTLNAKGTAGYGGGIFTANTSASIEIKSGTIVAEGYYGIRPMNAKSLDITGGEVTAIGSEHALDNTIKNSIPGEGWFNVEGTGDSEEIPVNNTFGWSEITSFKKVHFKAPHAHDFTYAADGATITATCGGTGCGLTSNPALTIAVPTNTLLSDTNTAPTASLTGLDAFNAATGTSIDDTYIAYYKATLSDGQYTKTSDTALASAPTTAGNYVAEITLTGVKTADSDSGSVTASVGYTLEQAYNLWIGGVQVTSAAPSGDGWAYDAETNTLTLNGFSSTAVYSVDGTGNAVIRHRGDRDLTISFTGKNTLDASGDTQFGSSGMWSDSRQLILCEGEGGGTLICKGSSNYGSGINVIGSAQTTVNSGTVTVSGPSGFAGRTNINGGEVTAIATGNSAGAINGNYTNAIPGEAWDNAEGTGNSTPIETHETAINGWGYKRMHFINPYVALGDETPVTIKKGEDTIGETAPVVGDALTASCGATDLLYEWFVDGTSQGAAAADNTSYTVKAADVGKTIVAKAYQTKDASGQDYEASARPTKESAATSAVVKKTPEDLPTETAKTNSGISYVAETVTPTDGFEVSSSNTEYKPVTSLTAILDGEGTPTIYVRTAETADTAAGEWVAVALTPRSDAPEGLTATSATTGSTTDGAIIGTASSMEYKLKDGEGDWTAATNDKTTGLAAGTYLVRTKATAEYPASKTAEVTVESKQIVLTDGQKPTAKTGLVYDGSKQALLNAPAEALPEGAVEMQYALGKDATNPPEDGWSTSIPTATEAGEYTVWYKAVGDANHLDSEPGKVTSTIKKNEPAPEPEPEPAAAIVPVASGHVQNVGDVVGKASGKGVKVGTEGQSLRLEKFALDLPKDTEGGIEYRGHIQNKGWDEWVAGGKACGTSGQALRLEAVQVRLTGKLAETHDVWYRVHAQNFGTLGWARGEQPAGTAGQALRIESLEAQVLPKGETPAGYVEGEASYVGAATADVHVQDAGWTGARSALEFGTTGQSRRLEAVRLSVPGLPVGGGVSYEVHAQDRGWMPVPAAADGALAGTTGESKRLEAVRISLTGDAAKKGNFSVWYRVHSQDYGWLGWAHDGAEAGTSGLSKRAEAIDVQVLPQGQVPAGYDASKAACVNG